MTDAELARVPTSAHRTSSPSGAEPGAAPAHRPFGAAQRLHPGHVPRHQARRDVGRRPAGARRRVPHRHRPSGSGPAATCPATPPTPKGLAAEWDPTDQFPFRHIERCSKLWIARVNGLCHAGGLVLTVHCDMIDRLGPRTLPGARAAAGHPRPVPHLAARRRSSGSPAPATCCSRPGDLARPRRARWVSSAQVVAARRARRARWTRSSCRSPRTGPAARAAVKRDLNQRLPQVDVGLFFRAIRSPEMVEGMASFIEKRPPMWPRPSPAARRSGSTAPFGGTAVSGTPSCVHDIGESAMRKIFTGILVAAMLLFAAGCKLVVTPAQPNGGPSSTRGRTAAGTTSTVPVTHRRAAAARC